MRERGEKGGQKEGRERREKTRPFYDHITGQVEKVALLQRYSIITARMMEWIGVLES